MSVGRNSNGSSDHWEGLLRETERDDCISTPAAAFFQLSKQSGLQIIRIRNHLASCNLIVARPLKAEFANSQAIFRTNRRTENAAGHGARFVKFTQTSLRIENRTGLLVSEILEALRGFFSFIQQTCACVSGKFRREAHN